MRRPESLPIMAPFEITRMGVYFLDARDVPLKDYKVALLRFHEHWMNKYMLIRFPGFYGEWQDRRYWRLLVRRWERLSERNPNLTYQQFIERGGSVFGDHSHDFRLFHMDWIAYRVNGDRRPIGMVKLKNMRLERVEKDTWEASSQFFPGIPKHPDYKRGRTWGMVAKFMLNHTFRTKAGHRNLDIVQWDFPVDRKEYSWLKRLDGSANPVGVDFLMEMGDEQDIRADELPDEARFIRRASKPQAELPLDEQPVVSRDDANPVPLG